MPHVRIMEGYINVPKFLQDKLNFYIKKIFEDKKMVRIRDYYYTICHIKENEYLFGEMVKMASSTKELYFDEDEWDLVEEEIEKRHVKIFNRFLLYDDRTLILEDSYFLSRNTFKNALQNLLEEVIQEETPVFTIDITFKKSREELLHFINRMDLIQRIVFQGLKVPNPIKSIKDDKKMQKAVDLIERIKAENMTFESETGINIEADEVHGSLHLVTEGKGKDAKISGISKGQKDFYEVRSKIKQRKVKIEDDEDFIREAEKLKKRK